MHHNKLEQECKSDKNNVIKLLKKFKNTFSKICEKKNIKPDSKKLIALKDCFNETIKTKVMDQEYFLSVVGDDIVNEKI